MDIDKIIFLIDEAIVEAVNYTEVYRKGDFSSVLNTQKILQLLRKELELHFENIEENVLRAMHDVGMSSYKEFENTKLEVVINNVTEWLYLNIPSYKKLNPLNSDLERWIKESL